MPRTHHSPHRQGHRAGADARHAMRNRTYVIRTLRMVMPILLNFWSQTMRARSAPRSFMLRVLERSDTKPSARRPGFS